MQQTMSERVNIASREFKANPYPFYAQLRAEAPVYRTVLPDKQPAWLITRYNDVVAVLKDDQRFVKNPHHAKTAEQLARQPWVPPMFKSLSHTLLDSDGADHNRLRGLIHKAFTPRMIEQMRANVQTLSDSLLDKAQHKGRFDLIRDYALPIPLGIISRILGISHQDQHNFHRWTKSMMDLSASGSAALLAIPNVMAMTALLRRVIKERRSDPRDDLITALVQAEEAGDKLSEDELLAMIFVLLIAGHETTVNLIGSGMLALLENPDQMQLFRQRPELNENAVEELVRYVAPVEQATERYAAQEVTMHDITIPRGEMVLAVLASANRDERVWDCPDELDITRDKSRHLGFGQGIHYCVGAPLARLEGQIAIHNLVQRLPGLHLARTAKDLRWRPGLTTRGLDALPVAP